MTEDYLELVYILGALCAYRAKHQGCDAATNNPFWITTRKGQHILIDHNGTIMSGRFKGMNIDQLFKKPSLTKKNGNRKSRTPPRIEYWNAYGKEIKTNRKGRAALEILLNHRTGHIKNVANIKGLGKVDFIYGDENKGLRHIIKRRVEDNGFTQEQVLSYLDGALRHGTLYHDKKRGAYILERDHFCLVISNDFKGNKQVNTVITGRPIDEKALRKLELVSKGEP